MSLGDGRTISAEGRCLAAMNLQGRTVFDIGGYVGDHTLFFANRVGPTGRVITFEPHPENRATIATRVAQALLTNIQVREVAIGRDSTSLEFIYPDDRGLGSADALIKARLMREGGGGRLTFRVRTLDDEIRTGGLPDPDLVKIDVEGLEHDVLEGMEATARRCKPVIFVELHAANDVHERSNYIQVTTWLLNRGYHVTHVESGRALLKPDDATECYAGQHLCCEAELRQ